ncbi:MULTISPECIES: O-antigen ligase [unclassified Alcanivorax]|uniref:O-antigen ligase family protein n=1 Tax=unclassified Alcanivorax TaxID=2638842 RepID=UPI0012DF2EB8|nr:MULTISPECIES: O-antigen ligase family protein [unclassified Alcanivorax]
MAELDQRGRAMINAPMAAGKPLVAIGAALLLWGFAVTSLLFHEAARGFEVAVLAVGFSGFFLYGGSLRVALPVWLLVAATMVVLASWAGSLWHHPQWAESSPKVHRLTQWFSFIAIAWLLGGTLRHVFMLWSVAAVALLLVPWVQGGGMDEWQLAFAGERVDFGIHNAQHTTMFFATVLLGLVAFAPRMCRRGGWQILRLLLVFLCVLVCAAAMIFSQTRGVWLGWSLACLVMLSLLFYGYCRAANGRQAMIAAALLLLALSGIAALLTPIVADRLDDEKAQIESVMRGDIHADLTGSVAGRAHSWWAAAEWIAERPVLGWGGNGRGLVLSHSERLPEWVSNKFGHLHSSYLDTMVNFGLLGLGVLLVLLGWVTLRAMAAWRARQLPGDVLIFYLGFLAFWLVINLFESYLYFSSGELVFSLILGGVVSLIWAGNKPQSLPG